MSAFGTVPRFSLGVEEEFQLIDPSSGSLLPRAPEVIAHATPTSGSVHKELYQSMLETSTPICNDLHELARALVELRHHTATVAEQFGARLVAAGTHPTANWRAQVMTDSERYRRAADRLGDPYRRVLTYGHHIHVAVDDEEEAIAVTDGLRTLVPVIAAVSANSPFWQGTDTHLASNRIDVQSGLPRASLPPELGSWEGFEDVLALLTAGGLIESIADVWWDIRPRPSLGSVEVRVPDVSTTVEGAVEVTALVQTLVAALALRHEEDRGPLLEQPDCLVRENRWLAQLDGASADLVGLLPGNGRGHPAPAARVLQHLIGETDEAARTLGARPWLASLLERVQRGWDGAQQQRRLLGRHGSLSAVTLSLAPDTVAVPARVMGP